MNPAAICRIVSCMILMFASFPMLAQKNRPVVSDAITLINLLQKDYQSIADPSDRNDAMMVDRDRAINLLKSYMPTSDLSQISGTFSAADGSCNPASEAEARKCIDEAFEKIQTANAQLSALKPSDAKYGIDYPPLRQVVDKNKQTIFLLQLALDTHFLTELKAYWHTAGNPFLEDVTGLFLTKYTSAQIATGFSSGEVSIQKSLPIAGLGGLSFTESMDGLARFLAKRLKEELATQVFERVQKILSEKDPVHDQLYELKILLPKTTAYLVKIRPEQYANLVDALKEVIESDLKDLMANLPLIEDSPRIQKFLARPGNDKYKLCFEGLKLISQMSKVKHPSELIWFIENSTVIRSWKSSGNANLKDASNGIDLCMLLLHSFTIESNGSKSLINNDTWGTSAANPVFYKTLFGFWLQQDKLYYKIQFNGTDLHAIIKHKYHVADGVTLAYDQFEGPVSDFLVEAENLGNQASIINKLRRQGDKIGADTLYQFFTASLDFAENAMMLADTLAGALSTDIQLRENVTPYIAYGRKAAGIFYSLKKRSYANAITDAWTVYHDIIRSNSKFEKFNLHRYYRDLQIVGRVYKNMKNKVTDRQLDSLRGAVKDLITFVNHSSLKAFQEALQSPSITPQIVYNHITGMRPVIESFIVEAEAYREELLQLTGTRMLSGQRYKKLVRELNVGIQTSYLDMLQILGEATTRASTFIRLDSVVSHNIIRFAQFLGTAAKATNAEDFEKAVEAFALPAGNSRVKRESVFNISVNAYAGLFFGEEKLLNTPQVISEDKAANFAFAAPIGIGFSVGLKNSGALTLFTSVIDIGAFTSVRFKDSESQLPDITFKNVLAPGAQLIYGFPRSPFSIGAGIQYGPALRTVSTDTQEIDGISAMRYGISVTCDIPLMNLFTRSR